MTSFPLCPSLYYLMCSSHYTFPILHLIIAFKHAHLITQSLHISLHDSFLYLIVISFLHLTTLKPISHDILHILKIYILSFFYASNYTSSPLCDQLITVFLSPISFHPWRMPILQDPSWDSSLNYFTYSPHYSFLTYMSYYIELFMNLIKILEGTYLTILLYLMHPVTASQIHILLKYLFLLF